MEQSKKTSMKDIQEVSSPSERASNPSNNSIFCICSLFLRTILACLMLDPDTNPDPKPKYLVTTAVSLLFGVPYLARA
jgi:hypothetical protein